MASYFFIFLNISHSLIWISFTKHGFMKNFSIALNLLLLVAVGVLFYFQFSNKPNGAKKVAAGNNAAASPDEFRVAYFEMDSVEKSYNLVKDALEQLKGKEGQIARELGGLESSYKKRMNELNQRGPSMSQSEGEAAQRELFQMEQNYQSRKQSLEREFYNQNETLKANIKKEIEDFLKEYNKTKGYSYIMANEPGLFYFKDTLYDVTADVVNGLNSKYKKKN